LGKAYLFSTSFSTTKKPLFVAKPLRFLSSIDAFAKL
jgi:hypothetical protein